MGNNCCVARDRNDKVVGIENRNDKFFYFNYPQMLKDLDKRLADAEHQPHQPSTADLNHLKYSLVHLQMEVDYNKKNLQQETLQNYHRRLMIEVCSGDDFMPPNGGCSKGGKCLVRLEFRRLQKKTKKNVNLKNPKFYEVFKYPLGMGSDGMEEEEVVVQIIIVEQKDVWKVMAQERIKLVEFKDQLVHMKFLQIPMYKKPIAVQSTHFKHKGEISEFSFSVEGGGPTATQDHLLKQYNSNHLAFVGRDSEPDFKLSLAGKTTLEAESDRLIQTPNQTPRKSILSPPAARASDAKNFSHKLDELSSQHENPHDISCIINSENQAYSEHRMRLSLRVQIITDAQQYLTYYMREYQKRMDKMQKILDQYASSSGVSPPAHKKE